MKAITMYRIHRFNRQIPSPEPPGLAGPKPANIATLVLGSTLVGLLLLATPASASSFFFSTGDPDGKIATLSRPPSAGTIQTETADDFLVVSNTTLITHATFAGLLPLGAPLSSITDVEVELYHVFPADSADPPSGNVPTRTNSPADVEIASATRDGLDGTLSFTATLLNPSFTATNSVVNGIHKAPAQHTGGEGAVTGQEVLISVTFDPPISLPTNHYFFRPEVLLSSGNFLWLSAPKPILPPGSPFAADLQSWIRNDDLAPDWLRIGTDITGQGPFNASFSLSGETDEDNDGVADSLDHCPGTPPGAVVDAEGCSIEQLVPCAGPASGGTWKNHGQYVSATAHVTKDFVEQGLITQEQRAEIIVNAAQSDCGKKPHK